MEPRIVSLPALTVVGIGDRFISILSPDANSGTVIPRIWHDYVNRTDEIANRTGNDGIGVVFPIAPEDEPHHAHECYYLAGAAVTSAETIPEGMVALEIPAATYACYTHHGPISTLRATYAAINARMSSAGELRRAAAPEIEWYDERFRGEDPASEFDIYIPIAAPSHAA